MPSKILVVDDDTTLAKTIEQLLLAADFTAVLAYTAEDGLRLALSQQPDMVLLDVMVPNMGGWEVCRRLRQVSEVPIIFLTALGDLKQVVRGLEMGADDYVVKPFRQEEFVARIKAHLRRHQLVNKREEKLVLANGRLVIDLMARLVTVADEPTELTPREYDLLVVLASNAGRVITTADLAQKAWGLSDAHAQDGLKPYIHHLRKKIEVDPATPRWILTVRGVGYRFAGE